MKRTIKAWSKMSFYKMFGDNNGSINRSARYLANGGCSLSAPDPQHISPLLSFGIHNNDFVNGGIKVQQGAGAE